MKINTVLLTLVERQIYFEIPIKYKGSDKKSVDLAIRNTRKRLDKLLSKVFKTITFDNISEFASLNETFKDTLGIYCNHPYAS